MLRRFLFSLAALVSLALPANAQQCNSASGFLKSFGEIPLGNILVLGPDCEHVQDGGGTASGNVVGPAFGSTTAGQFALWADTTGRVLKAQTNLSVGFPNGGSFWTNTAPFNAIINTVQDRLFIDQCKLNDGSTGVIIHGSQTAFADTGAGAAINLVGQGWAGINASLCAVSRDGVAVVGYAVAQPLVGGVGIGTAGFGINNDTVARTIWAGYHDCVTTNNIGVCFGLETDVGNGVNAPSIECLYCNAGTTGNYGTVGHQIACGGGSTGIISLFPCTTAINIVPNVHPFDKGIVFAPAGLTVQSGGFQNAINFGNNARINWFRNNSSTDQLQAYVEASNTTLGTVVGHDILSLSFGGTPGFPSPGTVQFNAEAININAPSANNTAINLGTNATGDRSATVFFGTSVAGAGNDANILRVAGQNAQWQFNQRGTGTIIFSVNGTNDLFITNGANGISFPNYGAGVILSSAGGNLTSGPVVSANLNITPTTCTNQFLTALSATAVGTCTTDVLASAQHANQGANTQTLHGNAAGNPAWSAVILTTDVSGTLPVGNGGTGATSFTSGAIILGGGAGAMTASPLCTMSAIALLCNTTSSFSPALVMTNSTADASAGLFVAQKNRAGAGTNIGDLFGEFIFQSLVGAAYQSTASVFAIQAAAAVGNNIPTKLTFSTTNAAAQLTSQFTYDQNGHFSNIQQAGVPNITLCGTTPSTARGSDLSGEVTTGTGGTVTCTITFAAPFISAPPNCNVTNQNGTALTYSLSISAITVSAGSGTSNKLNWTCFGT